MIANTNSRFRNNSYAHKISFGIIHKQMTIILDENVYDDLASAYQAMATDAERESDALEWSNALIGDVANAAQ
jgi:hypothetical protein